MAETLHASMNGIRQSEASQLRLLLEELCCDLCRFGMPGGSDPMDGLSIAREYWLGKPGAFADIRASSGADPPLYVEVKHGYPDDMLVSHMRRKYGDAEGERAKLLLVLDLEGRANWPLTLQALRAAIAPRLELEVWGESELLKRLCQSFGVAIDSITADDLLDVRQAIDRAKGRFAFSAETSDEYEHDALKAELLWHFGHRRLRDLRVRRGLGPRQILEPGMYRNVSVLLADMCAFSSYMRDSPDAEVTRESLTAFYSKARYQIIDRGGMLYQFVGDEVIGFFGVPEAEEDGANQALAAAKALLSIGKSVSESWQRNIDRVQASGGLHIGLAMGDVQFVSLRPYSRTHMGALGDAINVAARLMGQAGPSEIVATNTFHRRLDAASRAGFHEVDPVEAKNVGRINGWKMSMDWSGAR